MARDRLVEQRAQDVLAEMGVGRLDVVRVPAVPVSIVDTTGAGDAFNAALAVALGKGKPLRDAIRFALYSGAFACTRLGVIPALPHRDELAL